MQECGTSRHVLNHYEKADKATRQKFATKPEHTSSFTYLSHIVPLSMVRFGLADEVQSAH